MLDVAGAAHDLFRRDIDTSDASLRRAFTPHPYEQRLTLCVLGAVVVIVAVRPCAGPCERS